MGTLIDQFGMDEVERGERMALVGLTREDVTLLRNMQPVMKKHVDAVVEAFYDRLLSREETRTFFADAARLARVKAAQREYLLGLCKGEYEEEYFERRLQIGVTHEKIGVPVKWYIAGNSLFVEAIAELLMKEMPGKPEVVIRTVLALVKIMNLDQQMVLETYASMAERLKRLGKRIQSLNEAFGNTK